MAWSPLKAENQPDFLFQVTSLIEQQVKAEIRKKGFRCQGEIICGLKILPMIYMQRGYAPVWFNEKGFRPIAQALVEAIHDAGQDGLAPGDYHLKAIESIMEEADAGRFPADTGQARLWADIDLVLTDAFLLLGSHLSGGRINPEKIHEDWLVGPRSYGMLTALNAAVTKAQLHFALEELRPYHQGYERLKSALQDMRQLASQGGWPKLTTRRRTLRPAEFHGELMTIRRIMEITGDLPEVLNTGPLRRPAFYDKTLARAVQRFQGRHGLEPDGLIGKRTRKAMNITAKERIRQMELNLERWRWMPNKLGERYVMINSADFHLQLINNGAKELEMKVVVGRPARQSPVFSSTMTYMVLNPYWNVPQKIAVEDILPKLTEGTEGVDYLANQSITVLADWSEDAQELEPESVNWESFNEDYFPLRLRQEPGEKNALGQIKFMFPNKFAVYLHDTPNKSHFRKFQRNFSSGCIRVENAKTLAKYLLKGSSNWTDKALKECLKEGKRQIIRLPEPITVHLLYMTAWVDKEGRLQFREDIYERDKMLDEALIKRRPYRLPASSEHIVNNKPDNWQKKGRGRT